MQSFLPVLDSRKRKIPGLWMRGSRYYAQLRIDLGNGRTAPRRLALEASNLDEAKGELERKRTERRDGKLPQTGHRPKFDDFAREYHRQRDFGGEENPHAGQRAACHRALDYDKGSLNRRRDVGGLKAGSRRAVSSSVRSRNNSAFAASWMPRLSRTSSRVRGW